MDIPSRFLPLFVVLALAASAGRAAAAAPTLTTISNLTGANEDLDTSITYAALAAASNAMDSDLDPIAFRFKSLLSGTLKKGGVVVPANGTLAVGETWTWTPPAEGNGTINAFRVRAFAGGQESSPNVTVKIVVPAVNDAPTFTKVDPVTVLESSPAYSQSWATVISAGPPNESAQTLDFTVTSNDNPGLFEVAPMIGTDGTLSFTLNQYENGIANIEVTLTDSGATPNGGDDDSVQSFVIDVTEVRDPPVLGGALRGGAGAPLSDAYLNGDTGPGTAYPIFQDLTVNDPDHNRQLPESLTVTVTVSNDADLYGTFALPTATPVVGGTHTVYTLPAQTPANAESALRAGSFTPLPNAHPVGDYPFDVTVEVSDITMPTALTATPVTGDVHVESTNDPPVVSATVVLPEIPDSGVSNPFRLIVSDPDIGDTFSVTVTETTATPLGTLTIVPDPIVGDAAAVAAGVQGVGFQPGSLDSDMVATFDVEVTDVHPDTSTGMMVPGGVSLTIVFSNDAPQFAGVTTDLIRTTDDPVAPDVFPFSTITVSDGDTAQSLTVTLSLDDPAKGSFSGMFNMLSVFNMLGQITGNAAEVTAKLRAVNFTPAANRLPVNQSETVTITITVDDGTVVRENSLTQIEVTAVDGAPGILWDVTPSNPAGVFPVPSDPAMIDPSPVAKPFAEVEIVEAGDVVVTVSMDLAAKGELQNLGGFAELTPGSRSYEFTGTAAAAETAIQDIEFIPDAGYLFPQNQPGRTDFTITASDSVLNTTTRVLPIVLLNETRNFMVTSAADDPAVPGTLRHAVSVAANDDVITFALPGYPAVLRLDGAHGPLVLNKHLSFRGPGADKLTISGDSNSNETTDPTDTQLFRVFASVDMQGLRFANGFSDTGGAIFVGRSQPDVAPGVLTLKDCVIADCVASQYGGAVDVFEGTLDVERCLFENNSLLAASGFAGGAVSLYTNEDCSFLNTTFSGNSQTAPTGYGGGALYVENFVASMFFQVHVTHCTFSGNSDIANKGSSIHSNVSNTRVVLTNSIFSDFSARNLQVAGGSEMVSGGGNLSNDNTASTHLVGGVPQLVTLLNQVNDPSQPGDDQVNVDPRLAALATVEGQTRGHRLLPDSPAIGGARADKAVVDQRGVIRNSGADSGALDGDALGRLVVHEIFAPQASADPHFIEFFNPRDQVALDVGGFEVWIDGLLRHVFTGPEVIQPGFGIILADTMITPATPNTPVVLPSVAATTPDLELGPRGRIELRAPAAGGAKTVEDVSYVAVFANSAVPTATLDFDMDSITLAPQFVGAAFVPHSLVGSPPDGGVDPGGTGANTSPGADTTPTPFGEDNAFPVANLNGLEITEDDLSELDVLGNDLDADGSDQLVIVDLNQAMSVTPPADDKSSILTTAGAAVEITPLGSPLRGSSVMFDPRVAHNSLPEGARVTDSFAYSIIDVGGGAVAGYSDAGMIGPDASTAVSAPSHRLEVGDTVKISGAGPAAYNGDHVINAEDDDSFTIPVAFAGNPGPLEMGLWEAAVPRSPSARDEALVEVSILGRNDPPVPADDSVATNEETILRIFGDPDLAVTGLPLDTDVLYSAPLGFGGIGLLADDTDPDTDDNPFTQLQIVGVCQATAIAGYAADGGGNVEVTTASGHGLANGDSVLISGYGGHPSYNAYHVIADVTATTFSLPITFIDDDGQRGLWTVLNDSNRLATASVHNAEVTLELRADRTHTNVVYNPRTSSHLNSLAEGQPETDTFYYAVEDTHGAVSLAQVTVNVTGVNDIPVPGNDPAGLAVFDPILTGGLTLEQLLDGADVLYVLPSASQPGQVSAALRPAGGDANDVEVVAELEMTDEDTDIDLSTAVLLGNDGEVDTNDDLSVEIGLGQEMSREGAAISISLDGLLVTYDPTMADDLQALAHNERLVDTFEITITDGIASVVSLVAVVVEGRNDQPVASAAGYSTPENQLLDVGPPGLLLSGAEIDQNMSLPDNQKFLLPVEDAATTVFGATVDVVLARRDGPIDAFNAVAGTPGATRIVSPAHGLQTGEEATLLGSGPLSGLYPVTRIDDDNFSIEVPFDVAFSSLVGGNWLVLASTFQYDPRGSVFSEAPGGPTFTLQGLAAGQSYQDTFTYTLLDGSFLFANDDLYRVEADRGGIELLVLANDTNLDGVASSRRIVSVGSPDAGGAVTINAETSLIYTPQTGYVGDEVFVYTIEDDLGNRATAKMTARVTVDRLNGNLRANGDSFTVAAGQSPLLDVLANDNIIPATGDPLQLVSVVSPGDQNGSAAVENGQIRYTPDVAAAVFPYTETFDYTMSGGGTTSATATVTVLVVDRSETLNVRADSFSVPAGSSQVTLNVLENDNILPGTGEDLVIESKTDPASGTVTIASGVALSYTPPAGFLGTETFTYTAADGFGGTGTAMVTVQVGYLTTNTDIFSVLFDDPGETSDDGVTELDVLANDNVLNGGGGQVTITSVVPGSPALGTMVVTAGGGSLSFDPAESEAGQANFTYTITDDGGRTATGTVTVVVIAGGIRASSDFFTVQTDSAGNELPVLANDLRISDLPGELSVSAIGTGPNGPDQGGTVEISADFKKLVYTAVPGFEGVESFTYTVTDGDSSDTALVSVRSTMGEMVAGDDAFLVFRGSTENRLAVLSNDRVIPDAGQLLIITATGLDSGNLLNPPNRGTLEIIEAGVALQYTPHPDNLGFPYEETFSYEISAGGTDRSAGLIRIEVLDRVGARDLETNHDSFTVRSDSGGTLLPVLANDSILPASADDWDITEVTPPTANVCSPFLTADFLDPAVLAAKLATPADPVTQFLWARFQPASQTVLEDPGSSDADLRATLVFEFNDVAESGSSIHDPVRFAAVVLRAQTQALIDDGAVGEQLIVLNRLLLEDALPTDLRMAAGGGVAQIVGSDLLYAPEPGFVGTERFTYRVSDGLGGTGFAEVIVRVGDVSVSDDAFTVVADGGPVALDVTANDGILRVSFPAPPDPAQADFSLSLTRLVSVDPPAAGMAVVAGDVVSFTPEAAFFGPAVLTYWVEDDAGCEFPGTARIDVRAPGGDRDSEVVTITVNGVNDPPELVDADPSATDDETALMPFANSTLIEYDEQRSQQVTVTINYPAGQGVVTGPFTEISPGVLQFTGTETEVTAALRALVFTPFTNRIPVGTTEETQFTVSMDDSDVVAPVIVDTAVTTVTPVNDPPVITGTVAGQKLYQFSTLSPFVGVNITEIDDLTLQPQTVTVQIDDPIKGVLSNLGGFVETPPGSGAYVFNGTAAAAATAVRGLVFTPTPGGRVTPSQSEIVAFDVTVDDGFAVPVVLDSVTTIEVLHAEIDSLLALDGTGQDDSQENASFGASVAISSDTLVVGSPLRDGETGSVFVHERLAGFGAPWGQVEELTAADAAADDRFGAAVAIDGDFLAVGATLEDAAVLDGGAVYIFHRNPADPNDWQQVAKLLPPVTNFFGGDMFGAAVAIQGDTLLVGSPNSNRTGAPHGGQVFVFEHGPGGPGDWTLSQTLLPSDTRSSGLPQDEGRFGSAVALDGNTAVIGDPGANSAPTSDDWNLGAVYIFTRTDAMSPWTETKRLDQFDDPGVPSFAGLGYSVDISGDRIVVGVHWDNDLFAANHPDSVRIYERDQPTAGLWGLVEEIAPADGPVSENFGVSVAISGDLLLIGSPGPTDGSGEARGFVEVYRRDPGTAPVWTAIDRLAPGAIAAEDRHGQSVAIDGFIGVAGASEDSVNTLGEADAGSARVYKFHYDLGPRQALPVPDQLAMPNAAFAFTVDPETFGDPVYPNDLVLGVQLANGSPLPGGGWLSFNPSTGEFSGTPVAGNNEDYDLVLFADNPLGTRVLSNQFSITVELDLAGLLAQAYDNWASTQFSPAELANPLLEATVWGMSANPDGDPHDNLMEMLFGTDPGSFDPSQLGFQKLNATQAELTFPLSSEFPLDAVHVEWSTDASNWSRDGVGLTTVPDGLGDLVATALVTLPGPEPKLFVRIVAGS